MKRTFTLIALMVMALSIFAQVEPTDTDSDGFRNVSSLDHLKWITENSSCWNDDFKMDNDIDAEETSDWTEYSDIDGFKPIALGYFDKFTGTFDGNGYAISQLYIHSDDEGSYAALFSKTEDATIMNLSIENCDIFSTNYSASALVGRCKNSTIDQCHSSGTVDGSEINGGLIAKTDNANITNSSSSVNLPSTHNTVGGLVGSLYDSTVDNCFTTGKVEGNDNLGGLVGSSNSNSTIENSYSTGEVKGISKGTGGFIGYNAGTIINCYSESLVSVTGQASDNTGGFVGENTGDITLCYAHGSVISEDTDAGGFVGYNKGSIETSYAIGNVTANSRIGGFVGNNESSSASITNCYSIGNVIATGEGWIYTGGFAGENKVQATLENSYSCGHVSAPNSSFDDIGGFCGDINSDAPSSYQGIIINSYWDMTTSGQNASSGPAIGKPSSEMKNLSTYVDWDFANVWSIENLNNSGYPHLGNYVTGIEDLNSNSTFKLYPNPASDYISIESKDSKLEQLDIYDITGKLVHQINLNTIDQNNIDISELKAGVYFVTVFNGQANQTIKLIKK